MYWITKPLVLVVLFWLNIVFAASLSSNSKSSSLIGTRRAFGTGFIQNNSSNATASEFATGTGLHSKSAGIPLGTGIPASNNLSSTATHNIPLGTETTAIYSISLSKNSSSIATHSIPLGTGTSSVGKLSSSESTHGVPTGANNATSSLSSMITPNQPGSSSLASSNPTQSTGPLGTGNYGISTTSSFSPSSKVSSSSGLPVPSSSGTVTVPTSTSNSSGPGPEVSTVTSVANGVTKLIPVIIGGGITSAIPLPSPVTATINPTGTVAFASASALSVQIVGFYPLIQSWIDNPKAPEASAAIDAIGKTTPIAAELLGDLGDSSGGGGNNPCGGKKRRRIFGRSFLGGVFKDLSDAVSCITKATNDISSNLQKAIDDGEDDENDIDDLVKTVTSQINNLKPEVDDLNDDDDNDTSSSDSKPSSTNSEGSSVSSGSASTTSSGSSSSGSSSSTGSSCTKTTVATVTECDVFCTMVTAGPSSLLQSCATSCVATSTTGCDATGTGVTSTSTATATPSAGIFCAADNPLCADDTLAAPPGTLTPCTDCVTDSAGYEEGIPNTTTTTSSRSLWLRNTLESNSTSELTKRTFVDPVINFKGAMDSFLYSELKQATLVPHGQFQELSGYIQGAPAAIYSDLGTAPVKFGVVNLYGCTSVIVISRKGVWMSHFWEVPSFVDFGPRLPNGQASLVFSQENFDRDVIGTLNSGCIFDQEPGFAQGIGCFTATGQAFNAVFSPQLVIVTPRVKAPNAPVGQQQYPDQVKSIVSRVKEILPSIPTETVIDYTATMGADPAVVGTGSGTAQNPQGFSWPQGKAMFRYDPNNVEVVIEGQTCGAKIASWEVWVEDRTEYVAHDNWTPLDGQIPPQKRDGSDSCPISASSSATGSLSSATASSLPATSPSPGTSSSLPTASGGSNDKNNTSSVLPATSSSTTPPDSLSTTSSSSNSNNGTSSPPTTKLASASASSTFKTSVTTFTGMVPGKNGVPGCAYVLADDLGAEAACVNADYCNCGGTNVPLLTSTVSNSVSLNCDYSTQPSSNNCPAPTTTLAPPSTTTHPPVTTTAALPPPYQTGTCSIHILQYSWTYNEPVSGTITIHDNGGNQLASQNYNVKWGSTVTVAGTNTKLPYNLDFEFSQSANPPSKRRRSWLNSRLVGGGTPMTIDWEAWLVDITAGPTKFDYSDTDKTKTPYCNVGGWDNNQFSGINQIAPNRNSDCYWLC